MSQWRSRRWAWTAVALLATIAAVGFATTRGFTSAKGTLWTEQPLAAAGASVAAPDWVKLVKALKPAVVHVSTKRAADAQDSTIERFFGPGGPFGERSPFLGGQPRREVQGLGSGFVINPDGHIVTNNHVIDGATDIRVKLADGRELPAKVVGRDPKTDLALLKIEATGLPVIPLGDSATLQVGEPVMAIGNPFGLEQTVTTGIVSATGRVIGEGPYDDFIQTDASINPGNSGGPLINAQGQAIGINTAIFSRTGGSVGIGFAIPAKLAKSVILQLADSGHVVRGWLGVAIQPVTPDLAKALNEPEAHGALVASVVEGSPAAKAGVKPGDVITEYDGRPIARAEDLPRAVAETPVGREVPLHVLRDGKGLSLMARVAQMEEPAERVAAGAPAEKPRLGVSVQPVTPGLAQQLGLKESRGLLVKGVGDQSPAANAGVRPGDVIVEVDRHPVTTVEELRQAVDKHPAGTPLLMLVHRDGARVFLAVSA